MRPYLFLLPFFGLLSACTIAQKAQNTPVAAVPPQGWKNIKIAQGNPKDAYGPCEPSIALSFKNPSKIVAGAILDRYYWSADTGKTWVSGTLKSTFGVFGDPVVLSDWRGNFYFAHLSDPSGKGWKDKQILDRIVVQKSTDQGKSWNNGSYMGLAHPKDQDKHWLIADPRNHNLYCSWTEFDEYDNKDTAKYKSRILFSASTDGGLNWSKALRISQFEGNCLDDDLTPEGAVPAVGPNGEVYVAWAWNNKIWFDKSLDGGKTWLEQDIVAAEQPGGWTFDIPGIGRANGMPILLCDHSPGPNRGTLYLNWADQRNGEKDTDIWMAVSKDGGMSWSAPKRVNDDPAGKQQFFTWMAIDQINGDLYTVFYDRRAYNDNRTDVYLALSRDGGMSFENHCISETPFQPRSGVFFGDYNHIAVHQGIVRPIWTRMDDGVLSVWTALINFPVKKIRVKDIQD